MHNKLLHSSKSQILVSGARAVLFCLEPEPTQLRRIRLRDLGLSESEPPKKVAAPQQ